VSQGKGGKEAFGGESASGQCRYSDQVLRKKKEKNKKKKKKKKKKEKKMYFR